MEMRLLTITSGAGCTGATISLLVLLKGLNSRGVKIMVIVPENGYLCEELIKANIPFQVIPYRFSIWPSFLSLKEGIFSSLSFINSRKINHRATKKIAAIIELFRPDIIHTNTSVINIGYILSRKYNIPHVWHIREYGDKDFDFNSYPSKALLRHRLSYHSHAIAITNDLARYYKLEKSGKVIYNGIQSKDDVYFDSCKRKTFLFVGRVTKSKGATDVVDAFIKFSCFDDKYTLDLIGHYGKRYRNRLMAKVKGTPAEGRVNFLGHRDDVINQMKTAKALIVPSFHEGFGRITAEAMFNGCLVIGRNTAGTKEQFDNGLRIAGREIGVRFTDVNSLADAIGYVSKLSDCEYSEMALMAQNVVQQLYSIEKNTELTYKFLSEIIK